MRWPLGVTVAQPFRRLAAGLLLLAVLGALIVEIMAWQLRSLEREEIENDLIIRSSDVRSALETRLRDGIYLTRGLVSFLKSQQGLRQPEALERWMASMLADATDIRNIGIAPNNRIELIYPLEGNEAALGLDYRESPQQWAAVKHMMETREPMLAGPLQLIQGSTALIYRAPVIMDGEYWGLVSTVMSADRVLGMLDTEQRWQDLRIQLQREQVGGEPIAIWGGELIDDDQPRHMMRIHLPGVIWRLVVQNREPVREASTLRLALYAVLVLVLLLIAYVRSNGIRQQLEREAMWAENERLKTDFISTINHELRTPLTSILGTLGLLDGGATGVLPDKAHGMVSVARRNAEHLLRLINDLLDIDKLAAGQLMLDMQPHRLDSLLQAAMEENHGFASRQQISWVYDNPHPEAWVRVDATRFRQVLDNLLSNAVKFSPVGATVSISVYAEDGGGSWCVAVADQGEGIAPEFQPRVFERFTQADGSSRRKTGGTGLGLAIARGLIQQMGGEIDFVSSSQGTCFTLHIPKLVN